MTEKQLLELMALYGRIERYKVYYKINVIFAIVLTIMTIILVTISSYYLITLGLILINLAWTKKINNKFEKLKEDIITFTEGTNSIIKIDFD
jgi:hypothetical protein